MTLCKPTDMQRLKEVCANMFGLTVGDLCRSYTPAAINARLVFYKVLDLRGYSHTDIASQLPVNTSTVKNSLTKTNRMDTVTHYDFVEQLQQIYHRMGWMKCPINQPKGLA